MTFCQETKDFIFQNGKKKMIGDLKKKRWPFYRVVVLKRVETYSRCQTWVFSGSRGGWNDSVLWTLWNKMVTVLARGFGRCRRRRVSVQVFRIRTRLESLSGFVLLSLLLRRSHHHQLHLHHHHEPNAPRRRRRAVHNVFGRKIFSCVCYSVHMLRSEKQLVRRRSPPSFSVSQLNIIEKNK